MRRIATICARGGSKGLPGKNTRLLAGKPLIAHAIDQARETGLFAAIAVSSDSPEILDVGRTFGADFSIRRPDHMATDESAKHPAIQHAVLEVERLTHVRFDVIVDLDVTSPLRLAEDIAGAVALLERSGTSNVITGAPARKNPYFNLVERTTENNVVLCKLPPQGPFHRRQDAPECFDMNAAVYVWNRDLYMADPNVFYANTLLYEMPADRSHDIDTLLDFEWVSLLMARRARGKPPQ